MFLLGGTNESDHSDSPSMRKCLRKTRGELLLREYEVWVHPAIYFHMFFHSNNEQVDVLEQTYQRVYHHHPRIQIFLNDALRISARAVYC